MPTITVVADGSSKSVVVIIHTLPSAKLYPSGHGRPA